MSTGDSNLDHATPAPVDGAVAPQDGDAGGAPTNRREPDERRKPGDRRDNDIEIMKIAHGSYIFREGAPGDFAFVVETGAVEIVKMIDGEEVLLGTVEAGGMFGEMALIDNKPRMAAARAAGEVRVGIITRDMMSVIMTRIDPFSRSLIGVLSDHVRRMAENMAPRVT